MKSGRFAAGRINYDQQSANYDRARGLSPETAEAWRQALAPFIDRTALADIVDVGSGTGRFAPLLAEWFDARVIGVEPSAGMRAAARHTAGPRVTYVGGDAQRLPLRDACCDVAWLSNVIHHVPDRTRCAGELARVLRARGRVLIAGAFAGRLDRITIFRFFPEAQRVAEQFPTVDATVDLFTAVGLVCEVVQPVSQQTCVGLRALAERTRLRADTTLELLTDEEFARGQAALEHAATAELTPRPVIDTVDLLVFRKTGS